LADLSIALITLYLRIVILFADGGEARVDFTLAGVSIASVTLPLILFNALFARQNGLDLDYL